jgi:single-strand DNA-binding protein
MKMNQIGLVGRMVKNAELKYSVEEKPYTTFTIAVNRPYKNQEGMYDADFIPCSAWGKLAESIAKYCGKGSLIGVNGRLHARTYQNKNNERVFTLDVAAEAVRFYSLKQRDHDELAHFEQPKEGESTVGEALIVAETKAKLTTKKKLPIPS